MFNKSKRPSAIALTAIVALSAQAALAAITIDSFESPTTQETHQAKKSPESWSNEDSNSILGGVRDGTVGCSITAANQQLDTQIGGGKFHISANPHATPSVRLTYDGTSGGYDGIAGTFSGVDLTENGTNDRLAFKFLYAADNFVDDHVGTIHFDNVKINFAYCSGAIGTYDATDDLNSWMSANFNALNDQNERTFELNFSKFKDVDLTKVTGLDFQFCSDDRGADYTLGGISAIPEPTSLAMISLVTLLGFAMRRRLCA